MKDNIQELVALGDTNTTPNDNSDWSIEESFPLNEEEEGSAACDHDSPAAGSFSDNTSCYDDCKNASVVLDNQPLPLCAGDVSSGSCHGNQQSENRVEQEEQEGIIEELKRKVQLLQKWNCTLVRELKKLRQEEATIEVASTSNETAGVINTDRQSRNTSFQKEVLRAIDGVVKRYSRWGVAPIGSLVEKALWNEEVYLPHVIMLASRYLRETILPHTISYVKWTWQEEPSLMKESIYWADLRHVVSRDFRSRELL